MSSFVYFYRNKTDVQHVYLPPFSFGHETLRLTANTPQRQDSAKRHCTLCHHRSSQSISLDGWRWSQKCCQIVRSICSLVMRVGQARSNDSEHDVVNPYIMGGTAHSKRSRKRAQNLFSPQIGAASGL
jgi:hypothetical protein